MDSKTLRKKFLDFFEKNDHVIIPSASLVPSDEEQLEGKEKVLFTTAGMQPLIPYLMGKPHDEGKKLADVQKCLRTDDIEEVGDAVHHTFFEMLGNWSLGDYWKEEAIELSFKFLIQDLKIPLEKLAISVFAGDDDAPRDNESANKWKELGVSEKRIAYLGKESNWWPTNPSSIGPCGSDTEMFIWTGKESAPEEFDPEDIKWVEVWNDVFMEFNRKSDGTLEELSQRNVDTGMGLERMLAVLNGKDNDYETDLFLSLIEEIKKSKNNYSERSQRIIADHLRAVAFLIAEGIKPDSKDSRGSVVHRLITRAIFQENKQLEEEIVDSIIDVIVSVYQDSYPDLKEDKRGPIHSEIHNISTALSFLVKGPVYKEMSEKLQMDYKLPNGSAVGSATISFYHQSRGIPEPVAFDAARVVGFNIEEIKPIYNDYVKKHQEASRIEKGMFKGGLADHSEIVTKYHTATHLLHQALRDVLGPEVFQKGSNITSERLRFDFSFQRKATDEEIKKVEDLVNQRIKEDLKVDHMIIPLEEAKTMNAIGLFNEKYADKVSIYGIGPNFELDPEAKDQRARGGYYSAEFCGGPHVEHTNVICKISIVKEEAISAGIRRIRAEIVLN